VKRIVILAVAVTMAAAFALPALAGASINPWFEVASSEIRNGVIDAPYLDAGVSIEAMLSSAWFIDTSITYNDEDLLKSDHIFGLGFEANVGFTESATVNQTGSLTYGCALSLTADADYILDYPKGIKFAVDGDRVVGFMAEGFVGPLTLWGGIDFPWISNEFKFLPTFGIRVEFEINL